MARTKSKSILLQIIKYISLGYTIAYEMQGYQSIYISGGGHRQVLEIKNKKELNSWHENIRQLNRSRYLTSRKMGNKMILGLNDKAKKILLMQTIKNTKDTSRGQSTLVIFDIPESARRARQALRTFLQNTDFKQLQKSVWMLPKDVVMIIDKLITELKVRPWVKVFRAEVANK